MFSTPAVRKGFLVASNMSDVTDSSPENLPTPAAESAPRARRVSTPRAKKSAKTAEPAAEAPATAPIPVSAPAELPAPSESPKPASTENDWPEPEAASTGNQSQSEGAKRKRRRRKGKGKSDAPQNGVGPAHENFNTSAVESNEAPEQQGFSAPRPPAGPQPVKAPQPPHQQQQPPRPKIDPELLTKMAWKIYLAEVSEEGVALIGDADAKDLSRRCFRLAEIFIEEQSRRR